MALPRCVECGKRWHADEMAAIAAAIRCSKRFGVAYRPYACPHGHGWHLTTQPLRTREAS